MSVSKVRAQESALQRHDGLSKLAAGLAMVCVFVNFVAQWPAAHRVEFSSEACHVSWALQHGRGFADPYFIGPSGPTAQMAPVYPFLHAFLCLMFGTGVAGWAAIVVITSLAWAAQWVFVYRFAALWGQARAGLSAALIGVLLPLPGRMFKWEGVFAGLAVAATAFELSRIITGTATKWTAFRLGLLLAAGVLISPATILIWPGWIALLLSKLGWLRARPLVITALLVAVASISIWTLRNYFAFHHFVFVRDDFGMAFASSNNDCAGALISENRACLAIQHPSRCPALLQELIRQGEYQFAASEMHRATEWIRANPGRFLLLTFQRAVLFWFPIDNETRASFTYGGVFSILTILGVFSLAWARRTWFLITITALLPYSVTYYFVQFEQRYLYPTLWVTILLGCLGMSWILARGRQTKGRLQVEIDHRSQR